MSPSKKNRHSIHGDHYGLKLVPQPSNDSKDPLRWPRWLKMGAIITTALFNFTTNYASSGLSPAIPILEQEFQASAAEVNNVLIWNFFLIGVGNIFWVPIAMKYGKRATLLISMASLFAVLVWTAFTTSLNELVAARSLTGFAAAGAESIIPDIVNEVFFLHERAAIMSIYSISIAGATAIGPLCAAFVIQFSPGTWRTFVWSSVALAGFNLIAIFLLYPESTFKRPEIGPPGQVEDDQVAGDYVNRETSQENLVYGKAGQESWKMEELPVDSSRTVTVEHVTPVEVSLPKVWTSFFAYQPNVSLLRAFWLPIQLLRLPRVLWVTFTFSVALAAQLILVFQFPILLSAPPYLFQSTGVGLIQIAAIIGYVAAAFLGGYVADVITAKVIARHGGRVFPEQRLVGLVPFFYIAPVGCVIIAIVCAQKLSWVGIAFGYGMLSFGIVYSSNIAITYLVESHPQVGSQCLVAVNVFKNTVAFLFLFTAGEWIQSSGWIQVYMIMFMLSTLSMIVAVPFYFIGAKRAFRKM